MSNHKHPRVTVQMASGGHYVFELYPEFAPNACHSVIHLAAQGAYDGHEVGRIVPGFVIQPCFSEERRPALDYSIDGEFAVNGFEGGLPMEIGAVAMAGDGAKLSSGSSFFITLGDHPRLPGRFTVIGKIVEGWEEVKRIEAVDTVPIDSGIPDVFINKPVTPEIMERITVETFGIAYPLPVKSEQRL